MKKLSAFTPALALAVAGAAGAEVGQTLHHADPAHADATAHCTHYNPSYRQDSRCLQASYAPSASYLYGTTGTAYRANNKWAANGTAAWSLWYRDHSGNDHGSKGGGGSDGVEGASPGSSKAYCSVRYNSGTYAFCETDWS